MTQIKSEKALNYLESNEYTVSHKYGDEVPCIDPKDAKQAIIIAESESEERHAIEAQQVRNKCFSDIKEFTAKREASDRKMDALHLKEVKRLKDYIETIMFAIERADHLCEVKRFVELNKPLSDILVNKRFN